MLLTILGQGTQIAYYKAKKPTFLFLKKVEGLGHH